MTGESALFCLSENVEVLTMKSNQPSRKYFRSMPRPHHQLRQVPEWYGLEGCVFPEPVG